jgi:hypothetical protein
MPHRQTLKRQRQKQTKKDKKNPLPKVVDFQRFLRSQHLSVFVFVLVFVLYFKNTSPIFHVLNIFGQVFGYMANHNLYKKYMANHNLFFPQRFFFVSKRFFKGREAEAT